MGPGCGKPGRGKPGGIAAPWNGAPGTLLGSIGGRTDDCDGVNHVGDAVPFASGGGA